MHMQGHGDREEWTGGTPGSTGPAYDPAAVLRSELQPSGPQPPSAPEDAPVEVPDVRQEMDVLEDRLREAFAEAERMREINEELTQDLRRLTVDAGDALAARTRADRLQRERDEARRRASHERALAADDRLRAAEAERLHATAEARASDAERALTELTDTLRATAQQLAETSGSLLAKLATSEEQVLRLGEADDVAEAAGTA